MKGIVGRKLGGEVAADNPFSSVRARKFLDEIEAPRILRIERIFQRHRKEFQVHALATFLIRLIRPIRGALSLEFPRIRTPAKQQRQSPDTKSHP
jgi:hypothetical protein